MLGWPLSASQMPSGPHEAPIPQEGTAPLGEHGDPNEHPLHGKCFCVLGTLCGASSIEGEGLYHKARMFQQVGFEIVT